MPSSSRRRHRSERSALFVRIPTGQAEALDRIAFERRVPKQELVADLVERYIADTGEAVVVDSTAEEMVVGRAELHPHTAPSEVLTLQEAAGLLQVKPKVVGELAEKGELPGRKLGDDWRFSRRALIEWLGSAV
jgi:excisionase family DNA binding protein